MQIKASVQVSFAGFHIDGKCLRTSVFTDFDLCVIEK